MSKKDYTSNISILNQSKKNTLQLIKEHLKVKPVCTCKYLKGRNVRLIKFIEANKPRKDATKRLRTFFIAIDIIKRSHSGKKRTNRGLTEYDITGYDKDGTIIHTHLREEREHSNRELYLISSFTSKK